VPSARFQPILDPERLVPARSGNPLYCHADFVDQLDAKRGTPAGQRASLLLRRLLLDERREFFKSTQGANKGWRRSRLGGGSGSHFYAWWAPKGALPVLDGGFDQAPDGAIFLRAIRHHDDHSPLDAHSWQEAYLPLAALDLIDDSVVPAPWTPQQAKFASARNHIRTLRGFPGSGKTTALWHAAESAAYEGVLYVTWSRDLAALADDYFSKLVPAHKRVRVITLPELLARMAGSDAIPEPVRSARARFVEEVTGMSGRLLGPWAEAKSALYDELHAHFIGSALPEAISRWPASGARLSSKEYRRLRERVIGKTAAESAMETVDALDRRGAQPVERRFFPELAMARTALERLASSKSWLKEAGLENFDCIALDEAQDLTPLESLLLIELARATRSKPSGRVAFLAAGDEAQTVRPTDFEWGWFHDLLYAKLGSPADFELRANLRSPRRIAELVNRVWTLYGHIGKHERPSGSARAELEDEAGDEVLFCAAARGRELDELLEAFSQREGLAIVNLGESIPAWIPEKVRPYITTPLDIKGLDFHSVCVLNGGAFLHRIRSGEREHSIGDLSRRVAIDQLRVAVSRPAERLYWLDVEPAGAALAASRELLSEWSFEPASPMAPEAALKTLEEETLGIEERVRLCEADARQFLAVKPDIAYSRALQAVLLTGRHAPVTGEMDAALRRSAYLTFAEISFCLAFRRVPLSPQLGNPSLYLEAVNHARAGGQPALAEIITAVANAGFAGEQSDSGLLVALRPLRETKGAMEAWLRVELRPQAALWVDRLEKTALTSYSAKIAAETITRLCELFELPQTAERTRRARTQAAKALLDHGLAREALELLADTTDCDPMLRARAIELDGRGAEAAEAFLAAGSLNDALRCYRSIPDFQKALELARKMGSSPATDTLEWVDRMRRLAEERPSDFNKVILPSEKKYLEGILETALGASRRKPAVKKAAAPRKMAGPRKTAPPGATAKRAPRKP
jgi:hypothetical protein